MSPKGGGEPRAVWQTRSPVLLVPRHFEAEFSNAAATVFGSGWAWLCVGAVGNLLVTKTSNQDNPISDGTGIPILGLDVWEHAYYLDYQHRRPITSKRGGTSWTGNGWSYRT